MKLTPRLKGILELIPENTSLGDVGSDHGYIPIEAVKKKNCPFAIASEIGLGPINNAKKSISQAGLSQKIQTRLGSGLKPYKPGEIETLVIAGMGGLLIRDILLESPQQVKSIKTFIFQPMVGQQILRKWLVENEFLIKKEILVKENSHIYEIFIAIHGKMEVADPLFYEIGMCPFSPKDTVAKIFLDKKIEKAQKAIEGLKKSQNEKEREAIKTWQAKKEKLEAIRVCL